MSLCVCMVIHTYVAFSDKIKLSEKIKRREYSIFIFVFTLAYILQYKGKSNILLKL